MNTWKVILATMVIFGAGVVTGALLIRNFASPAPVAAISDDQARPAHSPQRGRPPQQLPMAGWMRVEFLRRAQRELNLTPEQRDSIDKLIKASQERTRTILEPVQPKIHEELKRTREDFLALLTPEQRTRFGELLKQQHHRDLRKPNLSRNDLSQGELVKTNAP